MSVSTKGEHQSITDQLNALIADVAAIRDVLQGNGIMNVANLRIGSDKPKVAHDSILAAFAGNFAVNLDESTAGVALSGSDLPTAKTGAWALDLGVDGTVDITPAAGNATGYASGALAIAGIPAVAENHTRLGTVTVANASGSVFDPGTTNLDAVGLTVTYTDAATLFNSIAAPTAVAA